MEIHNVGGVGQDSNIYLIVDDVIALIDAGTGANFEKVRENMGRFGVRPRDVKIVVNTHCHFDHAGGDRDFIKRRGSWVAIHELEAKLLRKGDLTVTLAGSVFGMERLKPIKAARGLREDDEIELGELKLRVIHTPGHTKGGICLYDLDYEILFSGDTVFCGGVGRTDLPTGDKDDLKVSLQRLAKLYVKKLYPGHGPSDETEAKIHILDALSFDRAPGKYFKYFP